MKRAFFMLALFGSSAERSTARLDDHGGGEHQERGSFRVDLGRDAAVLHGKIEDAPADSWRTERADGDCELVVHDPMPSRGLPRGHAVGIVTLRHGQQTIAVSPVASDYTAVLPRAFAESKRSAQDPNETLRLDASGGDIAPFSLATRGIRALEVGHADAKHIAWHAGDASTRIRVKFTLARDHEVRCLTADDGDLTIAPALLTGAPTSIVVTRELVTSTITALGRIELVVASEVEVIPVRPERREL